VSTLDDLVVAAGHSVDPDRWGALFDELMSRIAGRFCRVEPRRRARAFVLGLIAGLPRKNCWTIAEHAGDASPDGMQHLLERARWDADAVRDDVRGYVAERLADPQAVLVVDETGDVKKGTATAGVQRQYTGTAGRVENAQVAVYLTYAGRGGHALIDRRLYLPKSWAGDPARRAAARIPEDVQFATKPALATEMIGAALDAGVPAAWVTGDEVYGADPGLRAELERRHAGYVLAVAKDHHVSTEAASSAPTPSPRGCPASPGSGCPADPEPRATAITTGPGSRSSRAARAVTGCSSAATAGPASWPTTAAGHRATSRSPPTCTSPGAGGPPRRTSRPARAWPGWTSTRSAPGSPGTGGSPWQCSHWPSSRSRQRHNTIGCHRPAG
jgi:hypothetical protein